MGSSAPTNLGRKGRAMRIRRLLAVALLGGAMCFALAQPASADPSTASNKELRDCVEKALKGSNSNLQNAVDDCHKAKSIVVPAAPELLWGSIAFLIVLGVLVKFAFPMLKKTLQDRQDKIRED